MEVCDLWFDEVLQTIFRQITQENEEIEKIEKFSQKPLELCTNFHVSLRVCFVCVCVCVCVCMCALLLRIIVCGRISGRICVCEDTYAAR